MSVAGAFGAALAALGPFEENPTLGVAWSGGGDSSALLDLAHEWALARGGRIVALHVDHGLRAESADEANMLAARAAALGIGFAALRWTGAKPATGIQNAARRARRDLLVEACRARGIFHLLQAHNADDQDETIALRRQSGSRLAGLAGMSAIVADRGVQILRPLLGFRHAELTDFCRARGLDWLEDPSNRDPRFARARLRLAPGPREDRAASVQRVALEKSVARLAAQAATVSPAGFVRLDRAVLRAAAPGLACGVLARAVLCVGAGDYAPSKDALAAAWQKLAAADPGTNGRTLGYCRLRIENDGRLLVARELRSCGTAKTLEPETATFWDGRFVATLRRSAFGLAIGALGTSGWAALPRALRETAAKSVPHAARASLPTIRDLDGIVAVPHLSYGREAHWLDSLDIRFQPRHALTGPAFVADGALMPGQS